MESTDKPVTVTVCYCIDHWSGAGAAAGWAGVVDGDSHLRPGVECYESERAAMDVRDRRYVPATTRTVRVTLVGGAVTTTRALRS